MNIVSWKSLGLFVLVLAAAGCGSGPRLYKAGGTVTQNGKAVQDAQVTFSYENENFATGTTDASGKYQLSYMGGLGTPTGKCKVTVTKVSARQFLAASPQGDRSSPDYKKATDDLNAQAMKKAIETNGPLSGESLISTIYADPNTSGLAFEVTSREKDNVFKIDLKE